MTATTRTKRHDPTWITCLEDAVDHAVTDDEMAAGLAPDAPNAFRALCGVRFAAAPMVCEPRPPCPRCAKYVRAQQQMQPFEERLGIKPGRNRHERTRWWTRLLAGNCRGTR